MDFSGVPKSAVSKRQLWNYRLQTFSYTTLLTRSLNFNRYALCSLLKRYITRSLTISQNYIRRHPKHYSWQSTVSFDNRYGGRYSNFFSWKCTGFHCQYSSSGVKLKEKSKVIKKINHRSCIWRVRNMFLWVCGSSCMNHNVCRVLRERGKNMCQKGTVKGRSFVL